MSSFINAFVFAAAFAQEAPAEPAPSEPTAPAQPTQAAPPPPPPEGPRSEGMRLGLDLGFWRSSGEEPTRLNAGSPSLIPLGADVSWRTSRRVLLGVHGHAALASRDDCLGDTDCTGRGYG